MSELKPCPFCGSHHITKAIVGATEKFLGRSDDAMKNWWFARIRCLNCGTEQGRMEDYPLLGPPSEDDYSDAITAWNRRADTTTHSAKEEGV